MKERIRKAAGVMREVWKIGKRWFGGNVERKLWLYDTLA